MKGVKTDVLIIGGGIVGLWLLNDLRQRGYSALLVERKELGGGQTCHSHVYIHQGHLYREGQVGLINHLHEVNEIWRSWVSERRSLRESSASFFGFQNPADAQQKEYLWKLAGLQFERVSRANFPEALKGGSASAVLKSPEVSLNGTSLVRELSRPVLPFIGRIDRIEEIRTNAGVVLEVVAFVQGKRLSVQPKSLVLAAGAANQSLLNLASGGHGDVWGVVAGAQQVRKAHMLVVEGQHEVLTPLTGVFQPGGLFLVSRRRAKSTVWVVSDDRSPFLSFVEDWLEYDSRQWLPRVCELLRELAPRHFKHPERLMWGVYDAPKAEGRSTTASLPSEGRIERFRFRNLWAIWPSKLTLAPTVSAQARKEIEEEVGRPSGARPAPCLWRDFRSPVEVAKERWELTPRDSWGEFRQRYKL